MNSTGLLMFQLKWPLPSCLFTLLYHRHRKKKEKSKGKKVMKLGICVVFAWKISKKAKKSRYYRVSTSSIASASTIGS